MSKKKGHSRRSKKKDSLELLTKWLLFLLIPTAVIGFLYLAALSGADDQLSFDFSNKKTANQWRIQGTSENVGISEQGIKITMIQKPIIFLSSRDASSEEGKRLFSRRWEDTPYVKFFVSPAEHERTAYLLWVRKSNHVKRLPFTIPALAESIVVDSRFWLPWYQHLGFVQAMPIRNIGLYVEERQIEIKRVEFLSVLYPTDLLKTVFQQLTTIHPIIVGSINYHYALRLLGHSYTLVLGLAVFILGVIMLFILNKRNVRLFLMASLTCFILFDLTYFQTLWAHAKDSYKISSLYDDRYEEFHSRFGEEFAELDQLLKKHVPEQSAVAFLPSDKRLVVGESNWIWFLYYGEYKNYINRYMTSHNIREMDYVFYYYPRQFIHDSERNLLISKKGKKDRQTWKTRVIGEVSEYAKLLQVVHD